MNTINEKDFTRKIKPIFDSVFLNANPYGIPFQPKIHHKILLYSFRWGLEEPWLDPIVRYMKSAGEQGFYVTAFYRTETENLPKNYGHWYVPLNEAHRYVEELMLQENAVYSVSGTWGIVCSDFDHALLGGSQLLINEIENSVPDIEYRVREFLETCKDYKKKQVDDLDWLVPQLEYIYGFEKARSFINEVNLGWLLSS